MSESFLTKTTEWAEQNVPRIAMLDASAKRTLIQQAIDDTSAARFLLNLAGSVGGALCGFWLAHHWSISRDDRWPYFLVVALGAFLASIMASRVSQALLHRKIDRLANL